MLAVALACQIGMALPQQGIGVLAVFLRARLHLGLAAMGGLVSATAFGMMLANVAGGAAVDRFGSRPVAAGGAAGVAAVLLWLAWRLPAAYVPLLSLFVLLGLLTAPVNMAGARAVFVAYTAERRGLAMGVRQTGVTVGSALAAALLPLAVSRIGLGSTFVWLAAAALAPSLLLAWYTDAARNGRAAGRARERGPVSGRSPDPGAVPSRGGWRRNLPVLRAVLCPAAVGLLLSAGQYDLLTYTIADLHLRASLSLVAAGLALAWVQVGGTAARLLFGWWSDRSRATRRGFVAGLAFAGCCLFVLLAVLPGESGLLLAAFFVLLGATGVGWNAVLITWAGEAAGKADAGLAMGVAASSVFLGAAVSPPVFGALVSASGSYSYGWGLVAAQYAVAAVLAAAGARWRPRPTPGGAQA